MDIFSKELHDFLQKNTIGNILSQSLDSEISQITRTSYLQRIGEERRKLKFLENNFWGKIIAIGDIVDDFTILFVDQNNECVRKESMLFRELIQDRTNIELLQNYALAYMDYQQDLIHACEKVVLWKSAKDSLT